MSEGSIKIDKAHIYKVVYLILILSGLFAFYVTGTFAYKEYLFHQDGKIIQGTFLEKSLERAGSSSGTSINRGGYKRSYLALFVTYEFYPPNGDKIVEKERVGSRFNKQPSKYDSYERGQAIDIQYVVSDPKRSRIAKDKNIVIEIAKVIGGLWFGVAFFFGGLRGLAKPSKI